MLSIGSPAPDFTLADKDGKTYSLSDFAGKTTVLYFYPKDNTSGCTKQAQGFAKEYQRFVNAGVNVVGISRDSAASHARFIEKYDLPFLLLSDPERTATEAYGVWQEKKTAGKVSMGVVRTTFILSPEGVITHILSKVKADSSAEDTAALLGI